MYARLENDILYPFRGALHINGMWVSNPGEQQLLECGYLPVCPGKVPEIPQGYYPVAHYEQVGDIIKESWTLIEDGAIEPASEISDMREEINIISNAVDELIRFVIGGEGDS